jgi:hypothetical protein
MILLPHIYPHRDAIRILILTLLHAGILEVNHFPLAGSVADWITLRQPASVKTE